MRLHLFYLLHTCCADVVRWLRTASCGIVVVVILPRRGIVPRP